MIFDRHPSPIELSRAVGEGPSRRLVAHLQRCTTCAETLAEWRHMDSLARELPSLQTSDDRRERVLAAVLREERASVVPVRKARGGNTWLWGSLAGAGVAALLLVVGGSLFTSPPAPPPIEVAQGPVYRGSIRAHAGARFTRESAAPDEVVRLHEGTISVDVEALRPGERFRVIAGDGEVEVHGTAFDVTAMGEKLAKVLVDHGVVEVRAGSRQAVVLIDGQSWEAMDDREVEEPPADAEAASPKRRPVAQQPDVQAPEPIADPAPATDAAPPPRHPMAELFDRGWKQLREGRPQEAAQTFGEALERYPADPLAEDASFWRGVALVRAQAPQEALGALTAFLNAYPRSSRIGETSALLGWILLGKGDIDGAEARFRVAEADRVPSVRASAQKGLEAARAMRHNQAPPR